MLKLGKITTDFFNENGSVNDFIIVNIYRAKNNGRVFFEHKTMIKSFNDEMKNANNVNLFFDENDFIISGQIGKYTLDEGLYILSLIYENGKYITKKYITKNQGNLIYNTGKF